jgi:two-component system, OmpR family, response regulator
VKSGAVLVVEDEEDVRRLVRVLLERAGHTVVEAVNGADALARMQGSRPDVVVLDVTMPELDGWQTLERIRDMSDVPVLMLTARAGELDKVRGLRGGADDYVTKPFGRQELLARVEALLRRRSSAPQATRLKVEDLELDLLARRVTRAGREVELTARELKLLEFLMRRAGQVVTRTMLLEGVWDLHFDPQSNLIDVHISRLRQAIDRGSDHPLIHTVRGSGYVLRRDS